MILAYLLIGGGVCWIISEVLELVFGGRTGLTLALTAAFTCCWPAGSGEPTSARVVGGVESAGWQR
jgi:hypothetical protein